MADERKLGIAIDTTPGPAGGIALGEIDDAPAMRDDSLPVETDRNEEWRKSRTGLPAPLSQNCGTPMPMGRRPQPCDDNPRRHTTLSLPRENGVCGLSTYRTVASQSNAGGTIRDLCWTTISVSRQ